MLLSLQVKASISEDNKAPARNNAQTFNMDPDPLKGSKTICPIISFCAIKIILFHVIKSMYFMQLKLFVLYNQDHQFHHSNSCYN